MTHEQFWLHGDEYDDRDKYYEQLETERVMLCLISCVLFAIDPRRETVPRRETT